MSVVIVWDMIEGPVIMLCLFIWIYNFIATHLITETR